MELAEDKQARLSAKNVPEQDVTLGVRPDQIMLCADGVKAISYTHLARMSSAVTPYRAASAGRAAMSGSPAPDSHLLTVLLDTPCLLYTSRCV